MTELETLLNTKDYWNFLDRYNLQSRLVFLGYGGSYAYGTNTKDSDIDIRGCALNTREDLLLMRDFEQVTKNDEDMDICVYSLDKLFKLLINCNPNTIEMLGLPDDKYAHKTTVFYQIMKNKHLFLSKRAVQSFGGYATAQLRKLNNKAVRQVSMTEREQHILNSMNNAKYAFSDTYLDNKDVHLDLYIDNTKREGLEKEIFCDVNLRHYPLRDFTGMTGELTSIIRAYNKHSKRNDYAEAKNKLGKHMMHLVRLYLMCFDILEEGEIITYREKDRDFLLSIRNGYYLDENKKPKEEFFRMVDTYETKLKALSESSKLPDHPDIEKINQLRMEINENVINNKNDIEQQGGIEK